MPNRAAVALATLVLAAVALEWRTASRAQSNAYRAGYVDGLRDVHRGLLDTPPDTGRTQ